MLPSWPRGLEGLKFETGLLGFSEPINWILFAVRECCIVSYYGAIDKTSDKSMIQIECYQFLRIKSFFQRHVREVSNIGNNNFVSLILIVIRVHLFCFKGDSAVNTEQAWQDTKHSNVLIKQSTKARVSHSSHCHGLFCTSKFIGKTLPHFQKYHLTCVLKLQLFQRIKQNE